MNPTCDKPGCGLEMKDDYADDPGNPNGPAWVCPRTWEGDSHALCAKLAESEAKVRDLEARLAEASKPCEWAEDEDEGLWTATCGLVDWCFNDGGPIENRVHFCIGCGHPVVVKNEKARKKGVEAEIERLKA